MTANRVQPWLDASTSNVANECAACGAPCPPDRRWCSLSCFYAEDGYRPDGDDDEAGLEDARDA